MKILSIETSCEHASVALSLDDSHRALALEGHGNHSEHLLASITALLSEADLSLGSLDGIAFGAGPGAFTGLRLACGVAQGLAMGAGLGIAAISSLAALAIQEQQAENVFVVTDARMGEVYSAAYRVSRSNAIQVAAPACSPPEVLGLPDTGTWVLIGSGLAVYADALRAGFPERVAGWYPDRFPRAIDVARLAGSAPFLAPEQVAPIYVRNKVALTTAERLARGGRV